MESIKLEDKSDSISTNNSNNNNNSNERFPPQIEAAIKIIDKLGGLNKSVQTSRMQGLNEKFKCRSESGREMDDEELRVYHSLLARVQSYAMSKLYDNECDVKDKVEGTNKDKQFLECNKFYEEAI